MRTYKEPKLDKFRKPPLCIPTPPEEPEECEDKTCIENDLLDIPKTLHSENNILTEVHAEAKNGHEDIVDSPPLEEDAPLEVKKLKLEAVDKAFTNCNDEEEKPRVNEIQKTVDKKLELDKVKDVKVTDCINGEIKDSKLVKIEDIDSKKAGKLPQKVKNSPKAKKITAKKNTEKVDKNKPLEEIDDVQCKSVKKKPVSQKRKTKKNLVNDSSTINCDAADSKKGGSEVADVEQPQNKIRKNKSKAKVKKNEAEKEETEKVESETIARKGSNQLSTPPRLKRTPKKNRRYQSDDENDKGKSQVSSEVNKKNNRPSTQRKRKLNFEEETSKTDATADEDKPTPKKKTKKTLQLHQKEEKVSPKSEELVQDQKPKKKKVRKLKLEKAEKPEEKDEECPVVKPKIAKKKKVKKADLKKLNESGKNEDSNKENDDGKECNSVALSENQPEKDTSVESDKKHEEQKETEVIQKTDTSETPKPKKKLVKKKKIKKPENVDPVENVQNCDTAAVDSKDEPVESAENESTKHPKEKREPIPCNHCGHVAGGRAALTRHLKKCPRVNQSDDPETKELIVGPYKCEQCDYSAKKRAMLARHLTIHNQFICLRCPFVGDTRDSWQEHMKAEHKDRADQKLCKLCSRYIKCSETPLEKHMAECKGRTPFTCSMCDKEFKYESSLKSHMISHNPNEPKRFHCPSCEYESNYKANLKKHLKNLHEERVRNIQCPKCDKLFYTEDNMRRHLKLHSQDRPFVCSKCNKTFKTRASLRGHIIVHDPTRPFKCGIDECIKDFRTSKLLKNHQEEFHHLSTKKFHCSADGCNFSFFKRSHLERHEITHTGERKFICPWIDCSRPFRHRDNLKVHMRQHTNEKPVKCDSCEFACRQRSSLHWHKKKCHPEQQSENSNSTDCTEIQSETTEKALFAQDDLELSDQKTLSPGNSSQNLMDLYEFKSDDDSGDESAPSLLGRDKDKLPPHVDFSSSQLVDIKLEAGSGGRELKLDLAEIKKEIETTDKKALPDTKEPPVKKKKKPGPKPKIKDPSDQPIKKKSPGRKKKVTSEDVAPPVKKKPGRKKKIKTEDITVKSPKKKVVRKKKKDKEDKIKVKEEEPQEKVEESEEKEDESKETEDNDKKIIPDESKSDSEKDNADEIESPSREKPENVSDLPTVNEMKCTEEVKDADVKRKSISDDEQPKISDEIEEKETELETNCEKSPSLKQEQDTEQEFEAKPEEAVEENLDKESVVYSDRSSDIESDFEDYKPPPAPRPPPICDSDEGDIESGPENEEPDSSRSFEMPPLDLSSTVKNDQQDLKKEKEIEIEADDPDKNENHQSVSDNGSNVQEVQETAVPVPVPVPEADDLQGTLPVAQISDIQQHGTTESFGEDSLSQVDKSYFDQYLPQFHHSVSQEMPEEEPKDMTLEEGEKSVEQCVLNSVASEKDMDPLSAATEELQACSPEEDPNMSHKRMEILTTDREQEDHFQPRADNTVPRPPERTDNVYEGFNSINPFMPTSRDTTILRQNDNIFSSSSSTPSFVRFSENDAVLARQRVATPFLPQNEHNSLQNLHRIADTALSQHNNPSLLRRPTTVPTREEIFPAPPTPLPQTMTRNPFHNSWSSQEVRPPHWGQTPYLQRPIDRQAAPTSSGLFSKDNYLSGRDFMFDTSCRSVSERNMFASLSSPQPQRTELPHESFQLERFDIGGYFSSHGYSAPTALDYTRPTCNSSQKSLDDRYRQTAGMTDFRTLPQTSTSDMFGSINMNSSFNLDKYVYQRDPVYHPPHVTESANSAFLTHSLPAQHSMFERDYPPRGFYHQNNPYSFMNEKQYAAAAAASAKLTHPASAVPQERDLLARPNTAAENQMQDPYRHHSMIYNMMNRYFE